ncbi:hypothetical protein [Vibrio algivorus]|uniref:DUF2057 domain-containing protein n=1 Tax=Vibrio algivorus TaxID=1667024 RepID=A0ABQ6EK51_9VIBR|nr:hypothetical protein [Vibrio algivorus]GLT13136.1 hypothetical protein GCM10007931_01100 [Vibrio algivorus]
MCKTFKLMTFGCVIMFFCSSAIASVSQNVVFVGVRANLVPEKANIEINNSKIQYTLGYKNVVHEVEISDNEEGSEFSYLTAQYENTKILSSNI